MSYQHKQSLIGYFANLIDRGTHHILLGPCCKQGSRLHLHVLTVHGCQGSCQKDKTNMSYLVHLHERLQRLQKGMKGWSHNPSSTLLSRSLRFQVKNWKKKKVASTRNSRNVKLYWGSVSKNWSSAWLVTIKWLNSLCQTQWITPFPTSSASSPPFPPAPPANTWCWVHSMRLWHVEPWPGIVKGAARQGCCHSHVLVLSSWHDPFGCFQKWWYPKMDGL